MITDTAYLTPTIWLSTVVSQCTARSSSQRLLHRPASQGRGRGRSGSFGSFYGGPVLNPAARAATTWSHLLLMIALLAASLLAVARGRPTPRR